MAQSSYFKGHWDLAYHVQTLAHLPNTDLPEIAFIGRSNVGKSSLLNGLTNSKSLSRTSKTPGRTQAFYFFHNQQPFYLVDMPGYGYAKISKKDHALWQNMIKDYLLGRQQLRVVCLLIDARHGLKQNDMMIIEMLNQSGVFFQPIFTKCDTISDNLYQKHIEENQKTLKNYASSAINIIPTSTKKLLGLHELRLQLLEYIGLIKHES